MGRATGCIVAVILILTVFQPCAASLLNYRLLGSGPACQPLTVPPQDRCSYVIEHKEQCYPNGGLQAYLRIHYCTFGEWYVAGHAPVFTAGRTVT